MMTNGGSYAQVSMMHPKNTRFCANCDVELDNNAAFCTNCGARIDKNVEFSPNRDVRQARQIGSVSEKSTAAAVILTALIPPLGYWYIGRLKRGIIVALMGFVVGILTSGVGGIVFYTLAIYDVYKLVKNEPALFDSLNRWNLG